MTDLRKAAEMALEALDGLSEPYDVLKAQEALRQALAQPEQEPVAWLEYDEEGYLFLSGKRKGAFPVFTAPPSKPWVSLTDEDIKEGAKYSWVDFQAFQSVAWWADELLKEKNT